MYIYLQSSFYSVHNRGFQKQMYTDLQNCIQKVRTHVHVQLTYFMYVGEMKKSQIKSIQNRKKSQNTQND